MTVPVIIGWSGGKDSALTLDTLRRDPAYSVVGLLTTVTNRYDRVSIHGVRRSLLAEQAGQLGLPVYEARVEPNCSNADYEASFLTALLGVGRKHPGVAHIAFGDLFLADVRAYRERLLQGSGWTPLFPLWEQDTGELARRFIESGYRARLVCVDTTLLEQSFVGREFDDALPVGSSGVRGSLWRARGVPHLRLGRPQLRARRTVSARGSRGARIALRVL